MTRGATDRVFTDAISQIFECHLVPLIFEPYAEPIALRLVGRPLRRVLETAAGIGVLTTALESVFPDDPPRFLKRTPHGYFDRQTIERDLALGGFHGSSEITTLEARSRAQSPAVPTIAFCQGTPLRNEIEARDAGRLAQATDVAAHAIAKRFGSGSVDGKIQAHIVTVGW
jgi:hypothetical protein